MVCSNWAKKLSLALLFYIPYVLSSQQQSFFEQSFFFDWNAGQSVPIPVTRQCDTIHIKWARNNAQGPNPTAPYKLQIYTSTFIVPFTVDAGSGLDFDWQVPFVPGTQYQICMFDKNGYSGGCQAVYTVIDPVSSPASCPNITFPGVLDVEGAVRDGPLSQYGWVDSCTDLQVTPKNGTPPYIFTAAPALHPPWNISVEKMESVNWTVALSWASPFFISLVDSAGNAWSNGPLHSGGMGSTSCLDIDGNSRSSHVVTPGIMAGALAGALAVGLIGGALLFYLIFGRSSKKGPRYTGLSKHIPPDDDFHLSRIPSTTREATYNSAHTHDSSTSLLNRFARNDYAVEPFLLPTPTEGSIGTQVTQATGSGTDQADNTAPRSPATIHTPHLPSTLLQPTASGNDSLIPTSPISERPPQSVYVVHHDAGRAPVTVYTADGAEVVELPPRYTGYDRDRPRQRTHTNERRFFTTNGGAESEAGGPSTFQAEEPRNPGSAVKP